MERTRTSLSMSMPVKVADAFRAHCDKKRYCMSGIVEDLILKWLAQEWVDIEKPKEPKK